MLLATLLHRWVPGSVEQLLLLLLDSVVCLGTAVVCGYIVGRERERHHKPAGVRTHILVCLGSAAFVHLGAMAYGVGGLGTTADFNRLVQSIATGIGFLGAGSIFRSGVTVSGVTTAASIWVMGAVGAAAGSGAVALALLTSATGFFVLRWTGDPQRHAPHRVEPPRDPAEPTAGP